MPLRQKLFLILGVMTLVPLLILQFGVVEQIEVDLERRIAAELQGKLSKMGVELDTLIENQMALAAGLAEAPVLQDFSHISVDGDDSHYDDMALAVQDFFYNYQQRVRNIQALRFMDSKGKTLVKVKEGHPVIPQLYDDERERYFVADQSNRPFYKAAVKDSGRVYVSDFELGQVQKDADFCPSMMRYSVPIRNGLNEVEGMVILNMWGTRIDEAVKAAISGYTGKAYIVEVNDKPHRDGIYLFHEDNKQRFANQLGTNYRFSTDLGEKPWQRIRNALAPGYMLMDDGRMFFYQHYSPYQDKRSSWVLIIETSYDEVFAPIKKIRSTIWLLVAVLLLLSLMMARWVASRMARPVQDLAQTITRYADGESSARYRDKERIDEIGIVGKAFNYLCSTLERTRDERDKAVQSVCQSERLAAVGQMAAGIGHEINNPLMNIMSLAKLIEEAVAEYDDAEIKADLKTLQEEGGRCARIVQGILKFARASEPSYESFQLGVLMHDTIRLLRHRADAASLKIETDIEEGIDMQGDPNQLQQVFVNVILNAIHASYTGGMIKVMVCRKGEKARVEISDQGKGIPEQEMPRVFNPFYSTKPEGQGTGLGLAVSYGIINKHGGHISIESEIEEGTCVRIDLPLVGMPAESIEKDELKTMRELKRAGG
ncbi:sensor histidine kinase [Sulfuriflexus mobilis]|uniref:sensor histidine kinase n=1 Tax=Sulfuriflexus mobilis TaxID=1811807 RepID=UPI000F83E6B6|nr:sensor histidine kinase [Sulfuriflexus mobilis]